MHAYVITLQETPERTARAKAHLEQRGCPAKFFYGIHAEKFGLATEFTYEYDNPGTNFKIGYKPTGIWLSHYMLWSTFNHLPDTHFLVMEIDVKMPVDWEARTMDALRNVPADFDMLYLGSCCCENRPKTHIKGDIYLVQWPLCTHAYIVARKALPRLLDTQRKIYAPIDISLTFHSHPLMKVYTVLPRIFDQFDTEIPP